MMGLRGLIFYATLAVLSGCYTYAGRHDFSEYGEGLTPITTEEQRVNPNSDPEATMQNDDEVESNNSENETYNDAHLRRARKETPLSYSHLPIFQGNERGLKYMVKHAKGANYYAGTCRNSNKDYVIAVEDSRHVDPNLWDNELHSFVKLLSYALASTKGTNTLSLVRFSSKAEKVLERTEVTRNTASTLGSVIDQMFQNGPSATEAYLGHALRFMRQHVYPNSHEYLSTSDGRHISVDQSAGKHTVVIIINTGSVNDSRLALEEALYARRNGVTFFSLEIGAKSASFWKQLAGCHAGHRCLKYVSAQKHELLSAVGSLLRSVCFPEGRNAVCMEEWSNYTACSKPCGTGVMTSTLKGYKTLLEATDGDANYKGLTCEQQLSNIKTKQLLCNTMACSKHTLPHPYTHHGNRIDGIPTGATLNTSVYEDRDGNVVETVLEEGQNRQYNSGLKNYAMNASLQPLPQVENYISPTAPSTADYEENLQENRVQDNIDENDTFAEPEYLDRNGNVITGNYIPTPEELENYGAASTNTHKRPLNDEHSEANREGASSEEQSFYRRHMYILAAAAAVFLVTMGASLFVVRSRMTRPAEPASEENEFLNSNTGGDDESAEKEQIASAEEAVWA